MKAVIMAGGKGARIASVARDIPKPMILVEGKPVLEHEIICLREQGITDILLTVGYLAPVITEYFGDGHAFGVNIDYYIEKEPLGNAGALLRLREKLTEDFLQLNADAIFDVYFGRMVDFHKMHGGLSTLLTHPNDIPTTAG